MINSFQESCKILGEKMFNEYNYSKVETLIWVYLNIYITKRLDKNEGIYTKEHFTQFLNNSIHFKEYYLAYHNISEEYYGLVHESILSQYSFNIHSNPTGSISLKVMEETYESFLQEEVRNATGSYYTPMPIVELITRKSIIEFLNGKLNQSKIPLEQFFSEKNICLHMADVLTIKDILEDIKIIDIACGGGVFLREAYKQVYDMLITCYEYLGISYDKEGLKNRIIGECIYGIDIQKSSITVTKLLLLMDIKDEIEVNFMVGSALGEEFCELGLQKFDIVVGNPPYIGEKGNKHLFDTSREQDFGKKYYEKGMDYFYFFIYRSWELLKVDGVLGYITTNYFVTADGAYKLRSFIKDHFKFTWIINFDDINIFPKAKGQHNMIFILIKSSESINTKLISLKNKNFNMDTLSVTIEEILENKDERAYKYLSNKELYTNRGHILIQCDNKIELLNKIEDKGSYPLGELCHVNQGIVSGADRVTKAHTLKYMLNEKLQGIFVLTEKELRELGLLDDDKYMKFIKSFYKNSQIKKYNVKKKSDLYILYINDDNLNREEEYPLILAHLNKFKSILEQRREVKNGVRSWFALQWPRNIQIFEEEKIVSPQRSLENTFAYSNQPLYASADIYYITKKQDKISLLYILGILNSSLMHYYLFHRGKRKGKYLELYSTPLKNIPIAYTTDKSLFSMLENYVKDLLSNIVDEETKKEIQIKIDHMVFDLYKLTRLEKQEIIMFKKPGENHKS